jgi:tyrosyl-tRNA synthetase
MPEYAYLFAVILFGSFVQGISGFGIILVSLPLLALEFDIRFLVPLISLGADLPELAQTLVDLNLCKSKGQARKDIKAGGVYINGERAAEGQDLADSDFIGGEVLVIRKGKKNYGLVTRV